jgi:membrane-bound serine protease (ClpP class)
MAPGTNIGAAYPVQVGGLPSSPDQEDPRRRGDAEKQKEDQNSARRGRTPMEEKVVNDTVSWVRSLSELRGRNTEWLTRAVTEAASASATEAVQNNVVDILARDFDDLMRHLHGREVVLPTEKVTLNLTGAEVRSHEMWWGDRILAVLANPNIAFLLMILGFYGILLEFYSPGWGIAGTLGVIFLVLGFFSMAVLPINYVGLLLVGIGLALFVAEAFFTSFGMLTLGGIICLTVGGLMLVDSPPGFLRISIWTVAPIALATAVVTVFLVSRIVHAHRASTRTGTEGMVGLKAVAEDEFVSRNGHHTGLVRAHGELWNAISTEAVHAGQALRVDGSRGLTLLVSPVSPEAERDGI